MFESQRPVLIVTAHYGNWELGSYWPGFLGVKTHIVARPIDNPHIESVIRRFREASGAMMLAKNGDAAEMLAVFAAGAAWSAPSAIKTPVRTGFSSNFSGVPHRRTKPWPCLHLTNALMYVVGMRKTGGFLQYTLDCTDLIRPEEFAGRPTRSRP